MLKARDDEYVECAYCHGSGWGGESFARTLPGLWREGQGLVSSITPNESTCYQTDGQPASVWCKDGQTRFIVVTPNSAFDRTRRKVRRAAWLRPLGRLPREAGESASRLAFSHVCMVTCSMEVSMNTITITLSDDRLAQLQEVAAHFKVSPEELVRVGIEELLARPDDAFERTVTEVLKKNAELYRRLA